MNGRGVRVVAALVTLASLAACTVTPPDPTETGTTTPVTPVDPTAPVTGTPSGGTLRIGLPTDPLTLDPRFTADAEGDLVVGALFEPLVLLDQDGWPTPAAAQSYRITELGTRFEFDLREATFHDGTPVTARDFVRTFSRIADGTASPPSFLAALLEPVVGWEASQRDGVPLAGIEAVDDRTLVVRLSEPQPRFLRTLANPSLVPTPPMADVDPAAFARQPVGNGPFALAGVPEPGGFIRLTAVPSHHRASQLDEVLLQVYPEDPDREEQWQDLRDGLLHVADLGPGRLAEAVSRYGESADGYSGPGVLGGTTSVVVLLGFDVTTPPFDDPVVRRAISLSINREAIATSVLGGLARPADRIVPPGVPGSQDGVCDYCRYDPEAAATLLAEAEEEVVLPRRLTFTHMRGTTQAAVGRRIAADVASALGIEVGTRALEVGDFVPAVRDGRAPWFRLGWDVATPDPGAYLDLLFHSRGLGRDNVVRYEDETTDELLDRGRSATLNTLAYEAYREAEQRILDDAVVIPLVFPTRAKVVAPDVHGLVWDATGRVDLSRVRIGPES